MKTMGKTTNYSLYGLCLSIILAVIGYSGVLHAADTGDHRFDAKLDQRGFIDVWQLRRDVAPVEALRAYDDTYYCSPEGDPDEELSAEQIETSLKAEEECEARVKREYAAYKAVWDAFNRAWLPAFKVAIQRGDPVAEVILRHCATTDALDRTDIESDCDGDPQRRAVAEERLNQIGFIPAMNLHADAQRSRLPYLSPGYEFMVRSQLATLKKFSGGALGVDSEQWSAIYPSGDVPRDKLEEFRERLRLILAMSRDATRAFTWSPLEHLGDWATVEFGALRLNRQPQTPGYLTWGPGKYYGGNTFPTLPSPYTPLHQVSLLAEMESNIDRYLEQEPRWAVFLLHRIGHHEWVPEGMQSVTHRLDPSWEGDWVLEKENPNWIEPMRAANGRASIKRDGEYFRMTIEAENAREPLLDVESCLLRYSGGLTYQADNSEGGPMHSLLGYFYGAGTTRSGHFYSGQGNREAIAPFDPAKRYKQVLMQCENAEMLGSPHIRFLLLSNDILVEFGSISSSRQPLAVRHWRRGDK
jgi:hypothetical protein